ncbi:unnamed protein product [Amoebophrya sp. A120]|nr:unnamed protein product [Amoebophrya sp. A120]|eukprot:GSA120T00003468001.1
MVRAPPPGEPTGRGLFQCPTCQRTFLVQQSFEKHAKNCKNVFRSKRPKFDARKMDRSFVIEQSFDAGPPLADEAPLVSQSFHFGRAGRLDEERDNGRDELLKPPTIFNRRHEDQTGPVAANGDTYTGTKEQPLLFYPDRRIAASTSALEIGSSGSASSTGPMERSKGLDPDKRLLAAPLPEQARSAERTINGTLSQGASSKAEETTSPDSISPLVNRRAVSVRSAAPETLLEPPLSKTAVGSCSNDNAPPWSFKAAIPTTSTSHHERRLLPEVPLLPEPKLQSPLLCSSLLFSTSKSPTDFLASSDQRSEAARSGQFDAQSMVSSSPEVVVVEEKNTSQAPAFLPEKPPKYDPGSVLTQQDLVETFGIPDEVEAATICTPTLADDRVIKNLAERAHELAAQAEAETLLAEENEPTLFRCANCSRSFNAVSYKKHVTICENVFGKKTTPTSSKEKTATTSQQPARSSGTHASQPPSRSGSASSSARAADRPVQVVTAGTSKTTSTSVAAPQERPFDAAASAESRSTAAAPGIASSTTTTTPAAPGPVDAATSSKKSTSSSGAYAFKPTLRKFPSKSNAGSSTVNGAASTAPSVHAQSSAPPPMQFGSTTSSSSSNPAAPALVSRVVQRTQSSRSTNANVSSKMSMVATASFSNGLLPNKFVPKPRTTGTSSRVSLDLSAAPAGVVSGSSQTATSTSVPAATAGLTPTAVPAASASGASNSSPTQVPSVVSKSSTSGLTSLRQSPTLATRSANFSAASQNLNKTWNFSTKVALSGKTNLDASFSLGSTASHGAASKIPSVGGVGSASGAGNFSTIVTPSSSSSSSNSTGRPASVKPDLAPSGHGSNLPGVRPTTAATSSTASGKMNVRNSTKDSLSAGLLTAHQAFSSSTGDQHTGSNAVGAAATVRPAAQQEAGIVKQTAGRADNINPASTDPSAHHLATSSFRRSSKGAAPPPQTLDKSKSKLLACHRSAANLRNSFSQPGTVEQISNGGSSSSASGPGPPTPAEGKTKSKCDPGGGTVTPSQPVHANFLRKGQGANVLRRSSSELIGLNASVNNIARSSQQMRQRSPAQNTKPGSKLGHQFEQNRVAAASSPLEQKRPIPAALLLQQHQQRSASRTRVGGQQQQHLQQTQPAAVPKPLPVGGSRGSKLLGSAGGASGGSRVSANAADTSTSYTGRPLHGDIAQEEDKSACFQPARPPGAAPIALPDRKDRLFLAREERRRAKASSPAFPNLDFLNGFSTT